MDLTLDSRVFARATADGTGSFARRLRVPGWALPGSTQFVATGESSGLTASASFLVDTEWGQPRDTATNRGFNPFENVLGRGNVADLTLAWSQTSGSNTKVVAARGFVVSVNERLSVLDGATGAELWSIPAGGLGPVATVRDGVVYAATGDGVTAYGLASGTRLWTATPGTYVGDRLTVVDGMVFYGDRNGFLRALDARTGESVWSTRILTTSTPAVADGLVFVESLGVGSFAVAEHTGQILWNAPTGYEFMSPTVGDGMVFESTEADGQRLVALDPDTGGNMWTSADSVGDTSSSPSFVTATGMLYVGSGASMYALDASTGDTVWRSDTGDALFASPAVANGVVYDSSSDGFLYAFDAGTGVQLGKWELGGWEAGYNSPIVVNGFVYVGSATSGLLAFSIP